MSFGTLKEAVEAALHNLGDQTTLKLVPELSAIDVSTSAALATLLLDSNNVVFREDALLKVILYFKETEGINLNQIIGQHQREAERRLSNAELRHVSRHCSAGLVLKQNQTGISLNSIDGPSAGHCDEGHDCEYLPLIGLAIGHQEGPIKTALDDLFLSRINRGRGRNTICTRFLGHLLTLWRDIISYWIGGQLIKYGSGKDIKCEKEASPNHLETVETARLKGKKRGRSPEQIEERGNAFKRVATTSLVKPAPNTNFLETSSGTNGSSAARTSDAFQYTSSGGTSDAVFVHLSAGIDIQQTPANWPIAIRTLVAATPSLKALPSSHSIDVMELFFPKTFAANFGSGSSGAICGWLPARRLKSFRPGVGHDQILRAPTNSQPFRPLIPCSSGLLLEFPGANDFKRPLNDPEAAQNHYYTTMVQPHGKAWLYCGEYRLVDLGDISWGDLPLQARKKWCDLTYLRRDQDGFKEILKAQIGAHVSKITIERGFENGHIKLRALGMQCVDYHEDIQKAITTMNGATNTDLNVNSKQLLDSPGQDDDLW